MISSTVPGLGLDARVLAAGIDRSPTGVAVLDGDGHFLFVNDSFCRLTARGSEQLGGLHFLDVTHPEDRERSSDSFARLVEGDLESAVLEKRYVRPDGSTVWAQLTCARLPGTPARVFTTVVDITAQRQHSSMLAHRAAHDELTGLPARGLFLELLSAATRRLARHPDRRVAVGFLDVDGLKQVNDTYGHGVGDELIAAVVPRVRQAIRPTDVVARVGGDEFTVLLDDMTDGDDLMAVAHRLLEALSEPFDLSVGPVRVTGSLGLVATTDPAERGEQLVSRADAAMYVAKARGGNRVEVFDGRVYAARVLQQRLESDLRLSLESGDFCLAYQPIIDLRSGAVAGVEALLRWDHPTRGHLTASEFIDVAERSGLIIPLGRWVLREACAQLARWDRELGAASPASMFINVSARQIEASDLIGELAGVLGSTGVSPRRICLEITETEILHDPDSAHAVLKAARDLGVDLAIDDFGTGYASLSRLTEIPTHTVKLDASFVREVRARRESAAVISATLLLAHNLRQNVIAEGLENVEDLDVLREMGCEFGQGFFIARPLSPAALATWVTEHPVGSV